ncbi:hypothetical protein HKX48_009122 [Thoreauomyces humboldtii]|nr:hypothetical protein HKX48_009122 [Thoreauomyces humboldtii]
MTWLPVTIGALAVAGCSCLSTCITLTQQLARVYRLRKERKNNKVPRLQLLILGCMIFNVLDTVCLVPMVANEGRLKEEVISMLEPATGIGDLVYTIQDNAAAYFQTIDAVYANASVTDRAYLDQMTPGMHQIDTAIKAKVGKLYSIIWQQLYNSIRGSNYAPSVEWIVNPREPVVTPEMLAEFTSAAALEECFLWVSNATATLNEEIVEIYPAALEIVSIGRAMGIQITIFTWSRVVGAMFYGLSVLNRFGLFSSVLNLPKQLIPALRVGLFVTGAFSVVIMTGIWWDDWNFNLLTATNTSHFYTFVMDVVVSSLMVKTILDVRREASGLKSSRQAAAWGVRVTVPTRQLFSMFAFLVSALVFSIALASLDSVTSPLLRMEMTSYREAVLLASYLAGFRFLRTLRSIRQQPSRIALGEGTEDYDTGYATRDRQQYVSGTSGFTNSPSGRDTLDLHHSISPDGNSPGVFTPKMERRQLLNPLTGSPAGSPTLLATEAIAAGQV